MSRTPTKSGTPVSKRQKTRAQWAREIVTRWNKSKEAVVATGQALLQAKADLRPGIFLEMIEQDLPFSTRSAQRFMKIASDSRLSDAAYAPFLPSAWTALYELIKLSDTDFAQALKSGLINPDMTRNDVVKLRATLPALSAETGRLRPPATAADRAAELAASQAAAAHFLYHDLISSPGGDRNTRAAMKLHTLLELDLAIDDITEDIFAPMTGEERERIEQRIRHLVTQLNALLAVLQRAQDTATLAFEFDWESN
ncbi:MAG: hypothetical protein MI824_13280 [Hyphomicrobiales bacterium]|nr:hypothetical protein [Hyphomicrobiales bacterium]